MFVVRAIHEQGCLFCRRDDGGFTSLEHIFAEALGNTEHVLDRGVVCDRCNNGQLAAIDGALVNFPPIAMRRTVLRIRGKRGTLPTSRWRNATLTAPSAGQIILDERDEDRPVPAAWKRTGANSARMTLTTAKIRGTTYAKVTRSIWKSALEFIYVDHGPDEAFAAKYDEVRGMVCGQVPAHGVLLLAREGEPNRTDVTLSYQPTVGTDDRERVFISAWYYGIGFVTELLVRELAEPREVVEPLANVYIF